MSGARQQETNNQSFFLYAWCVTVTCVREHVLGLGSLAETCVNLNWGDEGESERIDQFRDVGLRVPAVAPDAVAVSHRTPAGG